MAIVACGALLAMIASSMAFVQYDLPAIGYVFIYAASFVIAIRCYDGMLLSRFSVNKDAPDIAEKQTKKQDNRTRRENRRNS